MNTFLMLPGHNSLERFETSNFHVTYLYKVEVNNSRSPLITSFSEKNIDWDIGKNKGKGEGKCESEREGLGKGKDKGKGKGKGKERGKSEVESSTSNAQIRFLPMRGGEKINIGKAVDCVRPSRRHHYHNPLIATSHAPAETPTTNIATVTAKRSNLKNWTLASILKWTPSGAQRFQNTINPKSNP